MNFRHELKLFFGMLFFLWLSHFCIYNFFGQGAVGLFLFPIIVALALRVVFTPLFSYHLVLTLVFVFNLISEVKFFFSQKVLNSQDFVFISQASDVHDFLPMTTMILIGLALGTLFIPYKKLNLNWRVLPLTASLVLGVYSYTNNLSVMGGTNKFLRKYADIKLNVFNLRDNIKGNGILLHLTQTMAMGTKPEKGVHNFYAQRTVSSIKPPQNSPLNGYDIFLVTCESCYFEDNQESPLHNDFARLIEGGYQRTSMISPVYGGNTAEAEFELMTGLPAKGLPGIKFQLYGSGFSDKAYGFPVFAKDSGYLSYYYHNTTAAHWNRDVAMQKFSFKNTFFIDDMNFPHDHSWPRDFYLYDKVLAQYEESIKSPTPVFNQMMTVFSHGSYADTDGDGGIADYNHKVAISMDDYFKFEQKLTELASRSGRKVAIFLVGDHKPSLNKAYFKTQTISHDQFRATNEAVKNDDFRFKENLDANGLLQTGRVPFFAKILGKDKFKAEEIIKPLTDKPLFCFPAYLAGEINISKSHYFNRLKDICDENTPLALVDPEWQRSNFTPQLFAEQLF